MIDEARRACRRCQQATALGSPPCREACRDDGLPHRHWHCKVCGCSWIEAEVGGFGMRVDRQVPAGEVWFVNPGGAVVGKIVNVAEAR